MKVKACSKCLQGEPVREARLTTTSSASSILVIEDVGFMGPVDLYIADYRILEATKEEVEALVKAGYEEFASTVDD